MADGHLPVIDLGEMEVMLIIITIDIIIVIIIATIAIVIRVVNADMKFVQNFTPPDFQAKNFTP